MNYNPSLGIMGNIKLLYTERNKTNNAVYNNKTEQDMVNVTVEDTLCELDPIDRLAQVEEALIELEAMIEETL